MPIQNFDATNIPPQQIGGKHPEGNFPFQITNAFGQETPKNEQVKTGATLVVEFTSPAGSIMNYYNLFNPNKQTVEIAQKELSALCHATGVFKLSMADAQGNPLPMNMWAQELKGARGTMKVRKQANTDYMEIERIFDAQGNEPGKGGAAAAVQLQGQQSGGWGQTPPNNAPAATTASTGWSAGPSNPPAQQQTQGQGTAPPWAR